jgi:hypothetical protein
MKKITNTKAEVKGNKITITGDIIDVAPGEFKFPAQQVTIGYETIGRHRRHVQISSDAVFVKTPDAIAAIPLNELIAISSAIEPKTSPKPWFSKMPTTGALTVEFSSEIEPSLQWKWSDKPDPSGKWSDIAGATTATLIKTPDLNGKWVACVAFSEAGATSTQPIQI